MVLRVCRRVLGNCHDADDAFQATFLVLVKKAVTVAQRERLANWLYGVAYRVSLQVRDERSRRRAHEGSTDPAQVAASGPDADAGCPELDAELQHLPEKYRAPVVLCYLEGKTNEQAAQELAWPTGTVKIRLSRARDLLRNRLVRRGVTLTVGSLAVLLAQESASAAVPAALAQAVQGAALGTPAAAPVVALADAALKAGTIAKLKLCAAALVAASTLAAVGIVASQRLSPKPDVMVLADFDGGSVPVNQAGEPYPSSRSFDPKPDGGLFTARIETRDAVKGNSLRLTLTEGWLKAQFSPHGKDRWTFTRDYVADPAGWRLNTYDQMTLWLKLPTEARPYMRGGSNNVTVGTYCKRVRDPHPQNDLTGGGHFYHRFNVPAVGSWVQLSVNPHPHYQEGDDQAREIAVQTQPTGEDGYNYFDTLTRFYVEVRFPPASYPADYLLDEIRFERRPHAENDRQVYGIAATHVPQTNRVIVTWSRPRSEDTSKHEVRYAFRSIHETGWEKAQTAPGSPVAPAGSGTENGMVYDTTELPLAGQSVVYLAIRPQNADRFTQVAVPLILK
jgi:RNA polymerase sigma factor (sigma-70 family)